MSTSSRNDHLGSTTSARFAEKTYAGVVGKLVGVYLGRAVEGWTYNAINTTFGDIDYFVNDKIKVPLIVPDDDISGTFLFYRALEDNNFPRDISARAIGDTWLNYLVEDKTALWWGGMGRSTEHTAYLRLKAGIHAPESGSARLNGRGMSEAIGSQIFIDTWAMANPAHPERAAYMARKAASVSHDGVAIEAAVLLAAMESAAFEESNIDRLLDIGLSFARDDSLRRVIGDVRNECAKRADWRDVRQWLEENHSYKHYPGNCPMVPNHALVLASLILGGDDIQRGLRIVVSSGWDTDCNAGNLACLNGIRLGIKAFDEGPDFRGAIADRMYVVGADGGECMSDAVIETRRVLRAAAALAGEEYAGSPSRFAFEFPGAVQGFQACPMHEGRQAVTAVGNLNEHEAANGLEIRYGGLASGVKGSVSVQTFIDPRPVAQSDTSYFEVIASPSVYGTQTVRATVRAYDERNPLLSFFIVHYDGDGKLVKKVAVPQPLARGDNRLSWKIPDVGGHPIQRLGIELAASKRLNGRIGVIDLDWSGAPAAFEMGPCMTMSPHMTPFSTSSYWLKSFVTSAKHFRPDTITTFTVSHPESNGVATTGSRDWGDYEVASTLTLVLQKACGLVARARGHRRYYAGIIEDQRVKLIKRYDDKLIVLSEQPFSHRDEDKLRLKLRVDGSRLSLSIDGKTLLTAEDTSFSSGGAGFFIEEGTSLALGFSVHAIDPASGSRA